MILAADFVAVGGGYYYDAEFGPCCCCCCCFVPVFQEEMLGEDLCGRLGRTCAFLGM